MTPILEQLEALFEIECQTHRHDLKRLAEVSADRDRLRAFCRELFAESEWPAGSDIGGFTFQELAVAHGLLREETRTEPCVKGCHCEQNYGIKELAKGLTCYRKADWLAEKIEAPHG